ncbi:MAG: transporter [Flavisolibacter sp.]
MFGVIIEVHCFSQQTGKIETDRPDQTESPYLVPKKWFQSETGFSFEETRGGYKSFVYPTMLNKYGVSNRLELRLITTWSSFETPSDVPSIKIVERGLEPVLIGAKVALFEEKNLRPKTSILFHTSIPQAASKVYRISRITPDFKLAMQHSITKNIALGYNIGAEWYGLADSPAWFISLTSGIDFGNWSAYGEIYNILQHGEHPLNNIDAGISYTFNDNYKFDLSYGYGLNPHAYFGHYVSFGFSFRVK